MAQGPNEGTGLDQLFPTSTYGVYLSEQCFEVFDIFGVIRQKVDSSYYDVGSLKLKLHKSHLKTAQSSAKDTLV